MEYSIKLDRSMIEFLLFLLILIQVIALFLYNAKNMIYLFLLADLVMVSALVKKEYFGFLIIVWILIVLKSMEISIAPIGIVPGIIKYMNIVYPDIDYIDIIGFSIGFMAIIISGFIFSFSFVEKSEFTERLILSFGIGTGLISFLMIILGIVLNLNATTIFTSCLALVLIGILINRKKIKIPKMETPDFSNRYTIIKILIVMPFMIFSLIHILFVPELYIDSLIYGAQWAKMIYENNRIPFLGGGPSVGLALSSNYPPAFQMLAVFIYSMTGENVILFKLLSLITSIFTSLLVYEWSKELFKEESSRILSLILLMSIPTMIIYSRVSSFYIYLLFQFSLGSYYLYQYTLSRKNKDLLLSVVFGGFSALSTYIGLLFAPMLFLILNIRSIEFKKILVSLIILSLVCSPWYLRNVYYLYNPVWPFGWGKYIDDRIEQQTMSHLNDQSKVIGFNYENAGNLFNSIKRLFFSYVDFYDSTIGSGLRPVMTLFAVPGILYWFKDKDEKMRFFVIWFVFILLFYMSILNMFERYIIIITVPTVLLSLYLINGISKNPLVLYVIYIVITIIFINSLYLSFTWNECIAADRESVIEYMSNLGNQSKILYTCNGDAALMWEWISENLPEDELIGTSDARLYYMNRTLINLDDWKLRGLYYSENIEDTVEVLKENKVKYLMVEEKNEDFEDYPDHFELVKKIGIKAVYKVK